MIEFSYIAIDSAGQIVRGVETAVDQTYLRKTLAVKGLELISCETNLKKRMSFDIDLTVFFQMLFRRRIMPMEKISFAQHLAIMLKTGVPIIEAIEILGSEAISYDFTQTVKKLRSELEKGKSISSILEKEKLFSSPHLAVLKAGETSGKISEALRRIGADLKRDYQMNKKIKGAMAYPLIITLTLLFVSFFIIVFVLPKVGEVFRQMNLKTPLPLRILLIIGNLVSKNLMLFILSLGALIIGFFFFFRLTKIGSQFIVGLAVKLPVIKKLIYEISIARFVRSLSSLLSSGVPIGLALEISGRIFTNLQYQKLFTEIGEKIKKGVSLTSAFKDQQKVFGGLLIKMCSVGERSGKLAEVLEELALFYEAEVAEKLENFSTIIEPILMIIVGLGVGGMILSILGPIYQMMGSLTM